MNRPSKYRNKPTVVDGIRFSSMAEAARWQELTRLVNSVHVFNLQRQPRFELGCPENIYVADFRYQVRDGVYLKTIVEDVKGFSTPKFRRDKKLWKRYGPCVLRIMKRKGGKTVCVEEITPDGKTGNTK